MAVRPIVLYPAPVLKTVCPPIESIDDAVRQVAIDLRDTLESVVGTGLAAPQIGSTARLLYIDATRHPKYADEATGPRWLVNPEIIERSGTKRFREGCLSLPDYLATVKRSREVTVRGRDLDGRSIELHAVGFEAVLLQHEIDHLDGILFIDRVEDLAGRLRRREE